MAKDKITRRLAAIVATDMVGYSRLMQADETGTISRQKAHRKDLIDPKIAEHHGRIVNTTGDGLIIEFGSAVDAVQCAVEVQRAMAEREAEVPEDKRIRYRIGVNIGDIVIDGDDIQGDGVIIAARLETLAEPGGICVSRNVFNQIRNKVDFGFKDLGPQKVKNIAEPVQAYMVLPDPEDRDKVLPAKRRLPIPSRRRVGALAALLLLLVAAGLAWWQPWVTRVEPASLANMALPLPKKPSIAVLPFINLSGEKTQDYLADGLSENIISALSKVPQMFVIARNSTFTFKGKSVKMRRVAEELGVRYVLEGSLQKSGDRIRVTARLTDAVKGYYLWSGRYDRKLIELFDVQDDITRKIVVALQVRLTEGDHARVASRGTTNLNALLLRQQAMAELYKFTRQSTIRTRELLQQAHEADPNWARPLAGLAFTYWWEARKGWTNDRNEWIRKGVSLAERAIEKDPNDTLGYMQLGNLLQLKGEHSRAIALREKAVAIAPNDFQAAWGLGAVLFRAGQASRAVVVLKHAERLSPRHPVSLLWALGEAQLLAGQYEGAIKTARRAIIRAPDRLTPRIHLTVAFSALDRKKEAQSEAREVLRIDPKFTVGVWKRQRVDYKDRAGLGKLASLLVQAGLPEGGPPLPKKPSIAVLRFNYLSGAISYKHIARDLPNSIILALSKVPEMIVISRNSSFLYPPEANPKQVSSGLGIRFVLAGTVETLGDGVRVTVQLIDAVEGVKGRVVWSERYGEQLDDLFKVHDKITLKIASALRGSLTRGEEELTRHKTTNLKAWSYAIRGHDLFERYNPADNARARKLLRQAVELDPNYAWAWTYLAWTHWIDAYFGFREFNESFAKAAEVAKKAIALAPDEAETHALKSGIHLFRREYEEALAAARRALRLGPSMAEVHSIVGITMFFTGNWDETIRLGERAVRLSPRARWWYLWYPCQAHVFRNEYDKAIRLCAEGLRRAKLNRTRAGWLRVIAFAEMEAGRVDEGRRRVAEALKLYPQLSIGSLKTNFRHFRNPAHLERLISAMRKARLPEKY